MTFSHFPFFLPKVRISNLPPETTEDSLLATIADSREVEWLRSRRPEDPKTAVVTLGSCQSADEAVETWNYGRLGGYDIFATRFTDEVHMREMRSHILFVTGMKSHRELRTEYSRFGPLFQAVQSERFSVGTVQFLRRKDAQRAVSDRAFFPSHPMHVSVRDLSLLVSEEQLIQVLSQYGRILDLTFRDLSEEHVLSVADVIFSQESEATACKAGLNRTTIGDSTLHVSQSRHHAIPDGKMAQRNQWVRLKAMDDFERCRQFGHVINWNICAGAMYVMFDSPDDAARLIQTVGGSLITNREFVESTGSRDLEIRELESVPRPREKPQSLVIEIDPLPIGFDPEGLRELCPESPDFEMHVGPSLDDPARVRVLIYPASKRLTVAIHTTLCNARVGGALLRPRRVNADDIRKPPQRKEKPSDRYGLSPVVVVDPAPEVLAGDKITRVVEPFTDIEVFEERSAVVRGARRIIFKFRFGKDRKIFNQMLLNTTVDDVPLKVQIVKTNFIPEQLPPP
jgi:RNA recognition motif-containing protein